MSISETLHYYNVGQLALMPLRKLEIALQVLDNKIDYMKKVAKQGLVADQVYADMRKYEEVQKYLTEMIEKRSVEEMEALRRYVSEAFAENDQDGRSDQFPSDYSII